jgi:hypothetical protein
MSTTTHFLSVGVDCLATVPLGDSDCLCLRFVDPVLGVCFATLGVLCCPVCGIETLGVPRCGAPPLIVHFESCGLSLGFSNEVISYIVHISCYTVPLAIRVPWLSCFFIFLGVWECLVALAHLGGFGMAHLTPSLLALATFGYPTHAALCRHTHLAYRAPSLCLLHPS